jgi:hypothetical protein
MVFGAWCKWTARPKTPLPTTHLSSNCGEFTSIADYLSSLIPAIPMPGQPFREGDDTIDDLQRFVEEEEFATLASKPGHVDETSYSSKRNGGSFFKCRDCLRITLMSGCLTLVVWLLSYRKHDDTLNSTGMSMTILDPNPLPHYACPAIITDSGQNPHVDVHVQDDVKIISNLTTFVQSFRTLPFDQWESSYEDFKAGVYRWKSERFAPFLQNGSTIYESASGIGLNLLLTLEILQQEEGIENLVVYGNDYVQESVSIGLEILGENQGLLRATKGRVGKFCRADSTDLHSFVPENAFDLVFTGYLTPLYDPLQLNTSDSELDDYYLQLCALKSTNSTRNSDNDDDTIALSIDQKRSSIFQEQEQQLFRLQRRQEDWFGAWVTEMIRIGKPGAPIIVEQISRPTCDSPEDWGGVAEDFWREEAVKRYGWNVDIESIATEDDLLSKGKRYNVVMQKSKNGVN